MKKNRVFLILAVLLTLVGSHYSDEAGANETVGDRVLALGDTPKISVIRVFQPADCGCCSGYVRALREWGFEVELVYVDELTSLQDAHNIPERMRSCHTAVIEDYFLEGHVPFEAIARLLEERPNVQGIALPGMPSGSPGMPGEQMEPLIVYQVVEGEYSEFMIIEADEIGRANTSEEMSNERAFLAEDMEALTRAVVSQNAVLLKNLIAQGKYRCCLEKACISCIVESLQYGPGSTCACLDKVVDKAHPCPECIGGILEGKGSPFLVRYFATSLADLMGDDYLDTLRKLISEKYGVTRGDQL